jgi:hypothetical protein
VSTSNHNKEILKKSQEESETKVDTESDINKLQSQFKNLDLNKMTLGNENNSGIIPRNNYKRKYVTHTSIIHNWYPKSPWYPKPPYIQLEEKELGIRAAYTAGALYKWNIDSLLKYKILNILHEIMMIANVYKNANRSDYQVSNHSIGNLLVYRKNIYENLKHLKYLTLTKFRWFKDVLLSRILIRMDNRTPYWKEKFIDYFAHKVKEKFNNCHNDYMSLTYGKVINALKHIELNLCMIYDLRLTNQDMKYVKLRSFYKQYSFPPLVAPYKKLYKSTKFKHNKKQPVYGQTSNYKNNCKVKDKIKEFNINDKLKFQLLNILSESDTKSEELLQIDDNNTTSQDEYSESSKDNEIGFCFCKDENMCTCRKEIRPRLVCGISIPLGKGITIPENR